MWPEHGFLSFRDLRLQAALVVRNITLAERDCALEGNPLQRNGPSSCLQLPVRATSQLSNRLVMLSI